MWLCFIKPILGNRYGPGEGIESEPKRRKTKIFFGTPPQKKNHPGPDGPKALGWCGRLRGPISSLSVINSDQL